ncbi:MULTISPECIES: hypothetical protein [Xanthomonas]|uniref:Uncharacterized protein n=1 Tax=Xanthomonas cucurbitae TaxID=56453 RepID=A0ABY7Y826_9XANT|nr:hypothetical protein [Xanthomonas cucurbitae]WDM66104.1 hypothetical protein K6981_10955 [Xanthomonas cucurbitae]WDM69983.1 hypothetical protein K6978_10930 [Xanthomonas cucurbitae]WDM73801.1 hypothetical protein K6982_09940 [Xanthomonas cucurbitae]WDM80637.1 hypothetical protein K6980_08295 [Xanthomonas cucurbitae]WDM84329.1 hypothetical protein K6979_08300 [Xanthomonas cucurbitae]
MQITPYPSLKKLAQDCHEWLERHHQRNEYHQLSTTVQGHLDATGPLNPKAWSPLRWLALYYDVASCDAFLRSDVETLTGALQHAVQLRALLFRWNGMYSDMRQDLGNWPTEFTDGMAAAGPAMLSWWNSAETCAQLFIEMAEKDQRLNILHEMRRIKHGSSDAFLIGLFSQAFGMQTDFVAPVELIPEYQALLDHWHSFDETMFAAVMQKAADFHITRSKDGTDQTTYEFEATLDRVFPAELLAVQALRRRQGLPEFKTDHLLIDTPWALVRDMPPAAPHPLAAVVEARLVQDYPQFR